MSNSKHPNPQRPTPNTPTSNTQHPLQNTIPRPIQKIILLFVKIYWQNSVLRLFGALGRAVWPISQIVVASFRKKSLKLLFNWLKAGSEIFDAFCLLEKV